MKDEKKRTLYLKVRVSPEEIAAIKKKFENSGMNSLSGFVRSMIFDGYIAQVNKNELKEFGDKLWRPLMFLQTKVAQLKH
ncbi:MAG: hypothetical protein K6C68_04045 [Ruminococcus sp.]|nr:hypothetical protein [Ruminococcus sp.]